LEECLSSDQSFNRQRQILQHRINLWADYFLIERIVDNEKANLFLKLGKQASTPPRLQHHIQLNIQQISLHIDLVEDRLEEIYGVGVEAEATNHPKYTEYFIVQSSLMRLMFSVTFYSSADLCINYSSKNSQ